MTNYLWFIYRLQLHKAQLPTRTINPTPEATTSLPLIGYLSSSFHSASAIHPTVPTLELSTIIELFYTCVNDQCLSYLSTFEHPPFYMRLSLHLQASSTLRWTQFHPSTLCPFNNLHPRSVPNVPSRCTKCTQVCPCALEGTSID
jgi:hypothetical protein